MLLSFKKCFAGSCFRSLYEKLVPYSRGCTVTVVANLGLMFMSGLFCYAAVFEVFVISRFKSCTCSLKDSIL